MRNYGCTRKQIYNLLKNIDNIDCPSNLFNNINNKELNRIGNVKFINKYLFNLCSENTKCEFKGYITEKIMNCCLSGSIPIYFGYFDSIDEKIFNKNRIIFYDPYDNNSLINAVNFINNLYIDKNKLNIFYKQNIFTNEALNVITDLENELVNKQ